MATLRELSKRYGANLDRMPHYTRKFFERLSDDSQLPLFRPDGERVMDNKKFKTFKDWKVAVGDRVLLTKGPYKNTITKVVSIQEETNRIFVEDSSTKKVAVPQQLWQENQESYIIDYPVSVPTTDVKVVGTILDETTGAEKTIAADDVVFQGTYYDVDYKQQMPIRRIRYNEHIIIPWPRPEPSTDCKFSTSEADTTERTYIPNSLIKTGMPSNIVKSLRDPLAKRPYKWDKKVFTKTEINRLTAPEMPISEAKKALIEEKAEIRAKQIKEIPDDVKEFIGSKIAAHLNQVTDPYFAKFIERNSPDFYVLKQAKKELVKAQNIKLAEEARERNILLGKTIKKDKKKDRR